VKAVALGKNLIPARNSPGRTENPAIGKAGLLAPAAARVSS
jgi:hypothetical protein